MTADAKAPIVLLVALLAPAAPADAQFGAVGLSAVRGQRLADVGDPKDYVPEADDRFGFALASGDFDGDGADDLAIGIPNGDPAFAGELEGSGMVVVRYGVPGGGLAEGAPEQFLAQSNPGGSDPSESSDNFGFALAACDFNGDGFDDLAVGVPFEDGTPGTNSADSGAVDIFVGSQTGLGNNAVQHLTQNSAGFGTLSEVADYFGSALACGELLGGGPFRDLAIGVWDETFDDATDPKFGAGMVLVARGTATGLSGTGSLLIHQDVAGIADAAESFDEFGHALATLDMNGDGFDDLAIGVPGEDNPVADIQGRGAVHLLFGSAAGLATANNFLRTESAFNGNSELGDRFGSALAAGDFDGDGFDDLAAGVPFEDVDVVSDSGQVLVIYGKAAAPFFDFPRTQFWTENAIFGFGASDPNDRFGSALAAGDFDRDGRGDLAIGHPGESLNQAEDGSVSVIMGGAGGLSSDRQFVLAAGEFGLPGVENQANRHYGSAIATGDFDGDGFADLAVAADSEDEGGLADVGAAVVLYGSLFCDGFESEVGTLWSGGAP